MPTTSTPPEPKQAYKGVCESLVKLSKGEFDAESIRLILGDRTVLTLPDVGESFGVRPSTVRQSWRQAGMPGSRGSYSLSEILLWVLERNIQNEKHIQSTKKPKDRMSEIELEKAELDLQARRDSFLKNRGEVVPVFQVRAEMSAVLTLMKRTLLEIPRTIMPLLPLDQSDEIGQHIKREIEKALTFLSDQEVYLQAFGEAYQIFEQLSKKTKELQPGKAKKDVRSKRKT